MLLASFEFVLQALTNQIRDKRVASTTASRALTRHRGRVPAQAAELGPTRPARAPQAATAAWRASTQHRLVLKLQLRVFFVLPAIFRLRGRVRALAVARGHHHRLELVIVLVLAHWRPTLPAEKQLR